ncbi:anaerobic ribonucleoside-triphosphate reductase [uncultured Selenomonas sp.]|jgi:ribonucleoside-triphosphate reductase|uniref:anaerobic ribonucleoside-triphosphate reductase n=1 Tax=uncultured Selenomonas sp. TaxID=159275 RepID=UPI002806132D|nr:anaerobic ribonucleoside-triphosphate reductase [uncultured Selenomonas sp.]
MKALSTSQMNDRLDFIRSYTEASNASSGSEVDANANVTRKTLATLEAEMYKPYTITLNRAMVRDKVREMFGWEVGNNYLLDLAEHFIYVHDETSLKPYCASITLYPFLLEGTKCMGGVSKAPTNLQSFCGSFVNLVYQVASNFAGAVATVEFLHYFDYFARKQYGKDYLKTNAKEIKQELQGVVYGLNQPASARGDQSVFWNISVFDRPYMQEMFGNFYYPDGTQPDMDSLMELQKFFMEWFRKERHKELLTYPVLTASILTDGKGGFIDPQFVDFCAEQMSKGHSFFVYMSDSVDSLASCCRLRNELADNTFSYSLGAGGVVTGSAQVITINMNRLARLAISGHDDFENTLREQIQDVHKYLMASKAVYKEYIKAGLLPAYTAGFMDIDKQFLTIGVNGLVEAAERYGYEISNNDTYKKWVSNVLGIFKDENKKALQRYGCRFNTELVPAENLGVKNAKWDKEDGFSGVKRDCYNSYFYRVEDTNLSVLDKIEMYAHEVTDSLDGGSALHLNLEQLPSYEQAKTLFKLCSKNGVPYWTTNVLCTICNDCGTIDPVTRKACKKCGSENVDYGTRVIGYLKRITNFSDARQKEAAKRYYAKPDIK